MPSPATVGQFPYFPLEFNKDGDPVTPDQLTALLAGVQTPATPGGITDLFVISHGWNNDMPEAESLYSAIFGKIDEILARTEPACANVRDRRAAVAGILWPSKKFDDASLIPGGAADVGDPTAPVTESLDLLASFIGTDDAVQSLAVAKSLVPKLANSLEARDEFVRIVRAFMPHDVNDEEPVIANDLFTLNGDELLQRMSRPVRTAAPSGGGAADFDSGGAAGFTDWIG